MKRISIPVETNQLCHYGCGNQAKFKNGSGNLMCDTSSNSCPSIKNKNSVGGIRSYESGARKSGSDVYASLSQEVKQRMMWSKGKTADTHDSIAKYCRTRKERYLNGEYSSAPAGVALHPEMRWKRTYIPYIDSTGKHFKLESKHEWAVANELDKNGIFWIRPSSLQLKDGRKYEPDFYLRDYKIYLDPKSLWSEKYNVYGQKIREIQLAQLSKIRLCEEELNVKILVLMSTDKRSFTWEGILEQIKEYAPVTEWV